MVKYNKDLTKVLRTELDLSQRDLGDLVGVSSYTIQRWEYGQSIPRANHLGVLYHIAAQNSVSEVPLWVRDKNPVFVPIDENYRGEYTLPVRVSGRIIGNL